MVIKLNTVKCASTKLATLFNDKGAAVVQKEGRKMAPNLAKKLNRDYSQLKRILQLVRKLQIILQELDIYKVQL